MGETTPFWRDGRGKGERGKFKRRKAEPLKKLRRDGKSHSEKLDVIIGATRGYRVYRFCNSNTSIGLSCEM